MCTILQYARGSLSLYPVSLEASVKYFRCSVTRGEVRGASNPRGCHPNTGLLECPSYSFCHDHAPFTRAKYEQSFLQQHHNQGKVLLIAVCASRCVGAHAKIGVPKGSAPLLIFYQVFNIYLVAWVPSQSMARYYCSKKQDTLSGFVHGVCHHACEMQPGPSNPPAYRSVRAL